MAKHKGRGIATIEYPTGMNQNGDPSQAWVKLKPDGRVDLFSGTVDHGQGSRTVHAQIVADTLGVLEGEVIAKGAPDRKISIPEVAAAATWTYGELITGTGAALKPFADVNDDDGSVETEPHSAISYAACVADVEVDDETGEVTVERLIQVYDV